MGYTPKTSSVQIYGDENKDWTLQSDWSVQNDGYGLVQVSCNFIIDKNKYSTFQKSFKRGEALSSETNGLEDYTYCTVVKSQMSGSEGEIVRARVDYAGIEATMAVAGDSTVTQVQIASSCVSEPIESHPNFTKIQIFGLMGSTPLGGLHPPPIEVDDPQNPFRAKWIPSTTGQTTSWQFVGFLPSQKTDDPVNIKAGIKNYFRPNITLKLLAYTTNVTKATEAVQNVGWVTDGSFGPFTLPPPYDKIHDDGTFVETENSKAKAKNWLVTNANCEIYGSMYKVTADLMLSGVAGWDSDVYPYFGNIAGES